jgi:hypothetical protein
VKGASKFWVGVGMLLVLAGAAVWAEMQHRPAQPVQATPAAAPAPNAQQAPPATQPESAPQHHGGPAVGEG